MLLLLSSQASELHAASRIYVSRPGSVRPQSPPGQTPPFSISERSIIHKNCISRGHVSVNSQPHHLESYRLGACEPSWGFSDRLSALTGDFAGFPSNTLVTHIIVRLPSPNVNNIFDPAAK